MTACMNANKISGMMDVVTSTKESNAQFKMATANTEHGGDAMVKDLLEAMNDIKMTSKKNEVMTEKESIGIEFEVLTGKKSIGIESAKVMSRLRNGHTGRENRGTGLGTMKAFRSDSGACGNGSKSKNKMRTYNIGVEIRVIL